MDVIKRWHREDDLYSTSGYVIRRRQDLLNNSRRGGTEKTFLYPISHGEVVRRKQCLLNNSWRDGTEGTVFTYQLMEKWYGENSVYSITHGEVVGREQYFLLNSWRGGIERTIFTHQLLAAH